MPATKTWSLIAPTTAPFFVKYPSLMGFIVLVIPAEPERIRESPGKLPPSLSTSVFCHINKEYIVTSWNWISNIPCSLIQQMSM